MSQTARRVLPIDLRTKLLKPLPSLNSKHLPLPWTTWRLPIHLPSQFSLEKRCMLTLKVQAEANGAAHKQAAKASKVEERIAAESCWLRL
jgi:hypothetical protein